MLFWWNKNKQIESTLNEYDDHRFVSYISDPKSQLTGFIALHRVNQEIPAFGATRVFPYNTEVGALKEALRLSKFMSYKSALAGLKYGGGKAVLIAPKGNRSHFMKAYAEKLNFLNGRFITGADLGVSENEVVFLKSFSPFIVGVKSNPVYYTTLGIERALEVCADTIFGSRNFSKRSIAIQGMGKIGSSLLDRVYGKFNKIFISDIDRNRIKSIKKIYPKVLVIEPNKIHKQDVDIFCPCALGQIVNIETIGKMHCKIIAGGANDQLQNPQVGELLFKLGILYAPDYVINAGGLISVVNEYENKQISKKSIEERVMNIPKILNKILAISQQTKKATNLVADAMAEKIFNKH